MCLPPPRGLPATEKRPLRWIPKYAGLARRLSHVTWAGGTGALVRSVRVCWLQTVRLRRRRRLKGRRLGSTCFRAAAEHVELGRVLQGPRRQQTSEPAKVFVQVLCTG